MIKFLDLIKEEKQTFDYGCVMLYFDFPKMGEIHNMINSDDVYTQEGDRTFGLEDKPHCPYTSNFPDYHPHMTIGYLKPGTGKKYTEKLKNQEYELTPIYAVYSKPNGEKEKLKIKIK